MSDGVDYLQRPTLRLGLVGYGTKEGTAEVRATPMTPDMVPSHEIAQAWGYAIPRMNGKVFVSCRTTRYIRQ